MHNQKTINYNNILKNLNKNQKFEKFDDLKLLRLMSSSVCLRSVDFLSKSSAQLRQDIFVAAFSGFKTNGFFVEFGAADGSYLSNTHLLEKELGWRGILAEPSRNWHLDLSKQRSAHIDHRCISISTGNSVDFFEASLDPALSTIVCYKQSDNNYLARVHGETYQVETVTLEDLLIRYCAPRFIDYLSIDTEGSELDILSNFNFSKFRFSVITCEHNYTVNRNSILHLLHDNGYVRVLDKITYFDDWYVHETKIKHLNKRIPGWFNMSSQEDSVLGAPLTPSEKIIEMLRETVNSLIIERDAYKNAVNDLINKQILIDTK